MFMLELSKDPNHKGLKSVHLCFWEKKFALIHLQYQKYLYEEGNEEYINYVIKKLQRRESWLKDVCGCPECAATYKLLSRAIYRGLKGEL